VKAFAKCMDNVSMFASAGFLGTPAALGGQVGNQLRGSRVS
jgi:hypothetical protein